MSDLSMAAAAAAASEEAALEERAAYRRESGLAPDPDDALEWADILHDERKYSDW